MMMMMLTGMACDTAGYFYLYRSMVYILVPYIVDRHEEE